MPNLPLITSQVSARAGGIDSRVADLSAPGRALQGFGQALGQAAGALANVADDERDRERRESLALRNADAAPALARLSLQGQEEAPADGAGVAENVAAKQRAYIDDIANGIKDDRERQAFKAEQYGRIGSYGANNTQFEYKMKAQAATEATDASLRGLQNTVRGDGTQYDAAVKDGEALIDARKGLNDADKQAMKLAWRDKAATARFNGLMGSAASTEDFDKLAEELKTGEVWKKDISPQSYDQILDQIVTAKKTFATQADVQARAAIDGLEARNNDGATIPADELEATQTLATKSANPVTTARMMRIMRDQQIIGQAGRMTPEQLRTESRAARTGGTYPALPAELNDAVTEANRLFPGVSAGYLGGTVMAEYGGYISAGRRKVNSQYAPRAARADVNLKELRPEVADAVTLAGQILGQPILVTSGYRSQEKQNSIRRMNPAGVAAGRIASDSQHTHGAALDISTAGMSGPDKAKLVDALMQSGFTGFGEYDTHIHADMRDMTPKNFNAETGNLGWTKGSAEVIAVMNRRGYGASKSARDLDRSGSNATLEAGSGGIDYGRQHAGSSATGAFGFTNGTWLDLMKDGQTAAKLGIDAANMSDAQLLELRKDPRLSTLGAAALGEKNRQALAAGLKRAPNDAELYMAHFLGAGGSIALINARVAQGDMSAASLLPAAAKANPNVFYKRGDNPRSVKEVYDLIAGKMEAAPTRVAYGDSQMYEKMAKRADERVKNDPVGYAQEQGVIGRSDLNAEGGFASRGAEAKNVSEYYSIPTESMKPFTSEEVNGLLKQLKDGDAEQTLAVMARINEMDRSAPGMAKAAYAQLGEKDTTLGYAASLAGDRGETTVATQIVRGQKMLDGDKSLEASFGTGGEAAAEFNKTTGNALFAISASGNERNAIYNAARAHYAQTYIAKGNTEFSAKDFNKSINAVLGGSIGERNNSKFLLPQGVDQDTFDGAIENMTDQDLLAFSSNGLPPVDRYGDPVAADEIESEGRFESIGPDTYRIRMSDDGLLVTRDGDQLELFTFTADGEALADLAYRETPTTAAPSTGRAYTGFAAQPPAGTTAPEQPITSFERPPVGGRSYNSFGVK